MTPEDHVSAIVDFGFTTRQASFLVLVMRHAGVCVPRQYATFAGIANGGQKCNALFERLLERGYAVACDCVHNRARVYHVLHKPFYRAIREPESRYRRPVAARQVVERLMVLDAVLTSPDFNWLSSDREKVAFVQACSAASTDATPVAASSGIPGALVSTLPIGIDSSGRVVLLYVATAPWTEGFRTFVQAHAAFLRMVPAWTLRLVFPQPLDRVYAAYQQVVREELDTPLHPATVSELKWYFEHREAARNAVDTQTQAFLDRGAEVFSTPRFTLLYRRWKKHGDAVFEAVSSPVLADALASGAGRVESVVLSHTYRHLSPLVSGVRSTRQRVEKAEERGDEAPPRPQPLHQLPFSP